MNKLSVTILTTLIAILFSINVNAQTGYEDVVYLKNGSIIHGIIIEQIPNQSIKIQTSDKNVFVFKMDEIDKMTKEKKGGIARDKPFSTPPDFKNNDYTGYSLYVESQFGPGLGTNSGNELSLAVHAINGVAVKGIAYFGIAVGFDLVKSNYNYNNGSGYNYYDSQTNMMMDYYIDMRAFPVKGRISPLIIFDCGYAASMSGNDYTGGMMFNAGFGARLNFTTRMAINMSLNYKYQKLTYNYYDYYTNTTSKQNIDPQFVCLTIGLCF